MQPQRYCHSIQFHGSAHPKSRYQLKISEVQANGELLYRAQWDFPTLKHVLTFLKKYFPNSQGLAPMGHRSLTFETVLSVIQPDYLEAA